MRPLTTLLRYGFAAAAVAMATLATSLIPPLQDRAQLLLFAVAVTGVAWWSGWSLGVFTATLSVVLVNLFIMRPRGAFSLSAEQLQTVTIFFALAILISFLQSRRRRAESEVRQTSAELDVARQIQQWLLPTESPSLPGFDIAGISYPARMTGGDYFDYIPLEDGRLGIVLGDVSGHGLGPAIIMSETRAYLRATAQTHSDPGAILTICNDILCADMESGRFITLFFGVLDASARQFYYAAAGHDGVILNQSNTVHRLMEAGLPLGIEAGEKYVTNGPIQLNDGHFVILLTDGVTELRSSFGKLFGLERAIEVVRQNRTQPAATIVDELWRQSQQFGAGQPRLDDFSVVIVNTNSNPSTNAKIKRTP